jgi:heme A synthase
MVAEQIERDSWALIAVLVALNVLAVATVVNLGELVSALVLVAVSLVFITAVALWRRRPVAPRPSRRERPWGATS